MTAQGIGRVAAPPSQESSSGVFYFWVDKSQIVERTQIVTTRSLIAGREVIFVGVVQEVYRRSRRRDIAEESAAYDGRTADRPPFESEGVTYAEVSILRTSPPAYTPPLEESEVFLATDDEAAEGFGVDRMGAPLAVGLLRNGGTAFAGTARLDLDYLLGKNGGHLNVNGIAGLGTKSSLLMLFNRLLLAEAARQKKAAPSDPDRLQVVPIVFNVKNFDLFHLDRWNRSFRKDEPAHRAEWAKLGVEPTPFERVSFFAPQMKGVAVPVNTGRADALVKPYSWALADIVAGRLMPYLFSEEDMGDPNFGGLVGELEDSLTLESVNPDDPPALRKEDGVPQTFDALVRWFRDAAKAKGGPFSEFAHGTRGKLLRRLKYVVAEGDGVLRRHDATGNPLVVPREGTEGPTVIDLFGIFRTPSLQRFVVAAVFHQIIALRSGNAVRGLRYLITLDELNRFAPKGADDPITRQIEVVASEMRSQGVILLGAQQQASLVSTRVIENAAIRAVGRSGPNELKQQVWGFLGESARNAAGRLLPEDKLLYQPSFGEPMLVKIPFPPFALNREEAENPQAAGAKKRVEVEEA